MDDIPMHKFRERCKENFPRGGEWNVTSNSHICSKYFTDSDFVITPLDKRARRVEKRNSKLTYRYLNEDVFPTIFPNCPQYLSKKKHQTKNHPKDRYTKTEKKEMQLDSIKSLEDIENKLIINDKGTIHREYNFMVGTGGGGGGGMIFCQRPSEGLTI